MTDIEVLARLLLALGFGAILGLETETRAEKDGKKVNSSRSLGGVRTYTVLSLFGAFGGIFFELGQPIFAYLVFISVFLIILAAYVLNVRYQKAFGMTTEIAILISVLVGFAATSGIVSLQILVVLIVILTFILSQKRGIGRLTRRIEHEELIDVVSFLIVTLVVFPFLPDQDLLLRDVPSIGDLLGSLGVSTDGIGELVLFNPFRLWQYVVLISGFNLLGYFANRVFGRSKGLLFTGIFGGFVSSTSTTVALADKSKSVESNYLLQSLGGVSLIANTVSFLQVLVLAASASLAFFTAIVPTALALMIGGIAIGLWFMRKSEQLDKDVEIEYTPFSLMPAIKFAAILTFIRILVQLSNILLGGGAFILIIALSGSVGMDVSTISLGELVNHGELAIPIAIVGWLFANMVNYISKIFFSSLQGKKDFVRVVVIGLLASFVLGALVATFSVITS